MAVPAPKVSAGPMLAVRGIRSLRSGNVLRALNGPNREGRLSPRTYNPSIVWKRFSLPTNETYATEMPRLRGSEKEGSLRGQPWLQRLATS